MSRLDPHDHQWIPRPDRVLARRGPRSDDTMTGRWYVAAICLLVLLGLAASAALAYVGTVHPAFGAWWQTGLAFALIMVCAVISGILAGLGTTKWHATLNYLFIGIPLSCSFSPLLEHYAGISLLKVFGLTMVATVIFGIAGVIWPESLRSAWFMLWGTTVLLVMVYGYAYLAVGQGFDKSWLLGIADNAGFIVFGCWVMYDLNQAMQVPYNGKNAIDAASNIWLDVVNLFVIILRKTEDGIRYLGRPDRDDASPDSDISDADWTVGGGRPADDRAKPGGDGIRIGLTGSGVSDNGTATGIFSGSTGGTSLSAGGSSSRTSSRSSDDDAPGCIMGTLGAILHAIGKLGD